MTTVLNSEALSLRDGGRGDASGLLDEVGQPLGQATFLGSLM